MSNVRYIPISEDNFDTDEENIDDLLSQVDGLVKSSTINVLRGKNLNHIAVIDESVVGALYTEFNGSEFSFDVIVAKDNQSSGIGKELTSIAMSEYNMYADMGNVKLMLDVVNPRYNEFLINQYGLSIVDKVDGHIILTDKPDESSMTESVHDKFISFVEKFRKYDPILVEAIQHGYNVIFKSYNQLESINILLNDEATKLVNKYRIGGKHKDTELPTRDKLPHDTYVIIDLPLSELSNDEIESLKSNSDPDRVNSYSDIKIDTHIYAFKQRKTGEWYVSDGGHRVTAALKRGDHTIPAIVPLKDVYDMVSLNESANDRFKYTYLNDTFDKYKKVINDYYQKVFESLYENCRQVSDMRINLTDLDQKYRHLESMPIIFTATEGDQASFISIHNKRYIHIPTPSTLYTLATEFKLEYLDEVKKLFPDIDHEIAYKYLSVPGNLTQYKFDDGTDLFNSYISLWKEYKSKVSHIVNTTTRGIFIHEMVHAMDSTDFKFNDTDSKTKYQYYNSPHERNAYLIGLLSEVDMNTDFKDIIDYTRSS